MSKDKIEYWTKFAFDKMRKEGRIMPNILPLVLEMDDFKASGVTEDELKQSIKERFANEREIIKKRIVEKWNNSKGSDNKQ